MDGVECDYFDSEARLEWRCGPDECTNFHEAGKWVDSLGDGWRLPKLVELRTLYKKDVNDSNMQPGIELRFIKDNWIVVWSSEIRDTLSVWSFDFTLGEADCGSYESSSDKRVLAVREGGKQ